VTLGGKETYRTLSDLYAKDPKNIEAVFKLARKCESRYSMPDKTAELYNQVIALDPEGKTGPADITYPKVKVPYTEYAVYALGRTTAQGRKPDPAAMHAFIARYPRSPLLKSAYESLGYYYLFMAPKPDATKFFEEYSARYPEDPEALSTYASRILRDKDPVEKGIALAEKAIELGGYYADPTYSQNLAEFYILKGDKAKAAEVYGKEFIGDRAGSLAYALRSYAEFWVKQGENLESAGEMIEKAMLLSPDAWYFKQTAANVYLKAGQEDRALAAYGPAYAKSVEKDGGQLNGYAWYWYQKGKNLENALAAAEKAVALTPRYNVYDTLSRLQFLLKMNSAALASAEKALELAREIVKKNPGFNIKSYEDNVKAIKDALAKK
jgi:tetratricopeptide (TPR) repeat protein